VQTIQTRLKTGFGGIPTSARVPQGPPMSLSHEYYGISVSCKPPVARKQNTSQRTLYSSNAWFHDSMSIESSHISSWVAASWDSMVCRDSYEMGKGMGLGNAYGHQKRSTSSSLRGRALFTLSAWWQRSKPRERKEVNYVDKVPSHVTSFMVGMKLLVVALTSYGQPSSQNAGFEGRP